VPLQVYARFPSEARGTGDKDSSINNIHTIAFEVVPPHDFSARRELEKDFATRTGLEEQQLALEEQLRAIETSRTGDVATHTFTKQKSDIGKVCTRISLHANLSWCEAYTRGRRSHARMRK
jgi:hypothetical protein